MSSETACEFDQLQTAVETKSSQSDSYVEVLNENPAWKVIGKCLSGCTLNLLYTVLNLSRVNLALTVAFRHTHTHAIRLAC